jgi:hypothetical protein
VVYYYLSPEALLLGDIRSTAYTSPLLPRIRRLRNRRDPTSADRKATLTKPSKASSLPVIIWPLLSFTETSRPKSFFKKAAGDRSAIIMQRDDQQTRGWLHEKLLQLTKPNSKDCCTDYTLRPLCTGLSDGSLLKCGEVDLLSLQVSCGVDVPNSLN